MAHLHYSQHPLLPSQSQPQLQVSNSQTQSSAPPYASYNAANHAQNTAGHFTLPGLGFFAQEEDTSRQEEPMNLDDDEDEEYYNVPSLKHVDSVGQDSRVAAITSNSAGDASSKNGLSNGHAYAYTDAASSGLAPDSHQPTFQRSTEQGPISEDFSLPGLGALATTLPASQYTKSQMRDSRATQQPSHIDAPSRDSLPQSSGNDQQSGKQDLRRLLETQYAFAVQTLRELHACGISFEKLIALDLLDARDKANLAELFVQAGLSDGGVPSVRSLNQELLNMISPPADSANHGHSAAALHADAAAPYLNGTSSALTTKADAPAIAPISKPKSSSRQGLSASSSTPLIAPNPSVQASTFLTPSTAPAPGDRLSYLERLQKAKAKKTSSIATPIQSSTPSINAPSFGVDQPPASPSVENGSQPPAAVTASSSMSSGANLAPPSVPMTLKERLRQKIRQLKESPAQDLVAAASGDLIGPPQSNSDISLGVNEGQAASAQETDKIDKAAPQALPSFSAQSSQGSLDDIDADEVDSDGYEPPASVPARVEEMPAFASSQGLNLTPSAFARPNPMDLVSQSNTPTPGGSHIIRPVNAVLKTKEAELLKMKARLKAKLDQKKNQEQLASSAQRTSFVPFAAQGKSHAEPIDLTDEDATTRAANDSTLQTDQTPAEARHSYLTSLQEVKNVVGANEEFEEGAGGSQKASVATNAPPLSTVQERSSVLISTAEGAFSSSVLVPDHQESLPNPSLARGGNIDFGAVPLADDERPSIVGPVAEVDLRPTSASKRHAEEPANQTPTEKRLKPANLSTFDPVPPLSAKAQRYAELQRQMKELQAAMVAEESEAEEVLRIGHMAIANHHDEIDKSSKQARQGELRTSLSAVGPADVQMSDVEAVDSDNALVASHTLEANDTLSTSSLPPSLGPVAQHLPGKSIKDSMNIPLSREASAEGSVEIEENVPMEIEEIEVSSEEVTTGESESDMEQRSGKQGEDEDMTADASEAIAPINNTSDTEDGELDNYEPSLDITPIVDGTSAPEAILAPTSEQETHPKSLTDESMAESSEEGEISSGVEKIAPPAPRPPPTQPRNFHVEQRQPRFNDQSPRSQYSQQNNRRPQQMHSGISTPRSGGLANRPPQLPILGLASKSPPTLTKMGSTEGKDVVEEMKSSAGAFQKYESPLKIFKSFRFHPEYSKTEGGYQSLTYSNRLEPNIALCPNELETGDCRDPTCPYQHIEKMRLDGSSLLAELGGQNPGRTEEERQTYITGLRKLIQDMKARNLESAEQIASEIVGYRRDFLQDSTRVLAFDEKKA